MIIKKKNYNHIENTMILLLIIMIAIISVILYKYNLTHNDVVQKQPEYHFYFVAQNSVDPFWKEIKKGVEDAANKLNVAVEFNAPRFNDPSEEKQYLDIGINSNVDGIITHISTGEDFSTLISDAYAKNIPVVTIENDDKNSDRMTFIGSNSYLLGSEAAKLMINGTKGRANIAIIVSNDNELDSVTQNIKINGFLNTIKGYEDMKISQVYTSKMGILSAEEITQSIISNNREIDAIYTTNSVDTLGATQAIVDFNKVGSITIVGYGNTMEILSYIEKGIICGTVMSDPYKMGYESIKALIDIKKNHNISTFIDTGVKVITKSNIDDFEEKAKYIESY